MKKFLPLSAYYLTIIISYQVCRLLDLFTPSQLQIIHLPLVLLPGLIWKVRFLPFSRILAILAACIGLAGYRSITNQHEVSGVAVSMAQFSDDVYGKKSRVFLAKLEESLNIEGRAEVTAQHSAIGSRSELEKNFINNPELKLSIGGNSYWIKLVERPEEFAELNSFALTEDFANNLSIVTQVPVFALSKEPIEPTIQFLTHFINASHVPESLREVYLFSAAAFRPAWRQSAHLAYARFLAANQVLFKMLNSSEYQPGEATCVLRQYYHAANQIMHFHNPELSIALHNNIAVMYYLDYIFEHKKKSLAISKEHFQAAITMKAIENEFALTYVTPQIAKQNLFMVKGKKKRINRNKLNEPKKRKARKNKKTAS